MKDLIKNDDAVSVVVGSILVLAVLVTFMSVVTSSWVPIYEGNAESDHSEQTYKTFMDLRKQIEFADEFSRSTAIDLGTDEMPFMSNTNSVGYLEVNGSDGAMFITANLTTDAASSDVGYGLSVVGMDTNQTNPITNFSFEFTQINFTNSSNNILNPDFRVQMRTSTLNRWITLFATGIGGGDIDIEIENWRRSKRGTTQVTSSWTNYYATILGIRFSCGLNPNEKWVGFSYTNQPDGIFVDNLTVSVDMLSNINMTLIEPEGQNVTINGIDYNTTPPNNNVTSLSNLTQHYMRQPGDGTGGDYYIDYVQYFGIDEGTQIFTYNTTQDSAYLVTENGEMKTVLNNFKVGGGTLTLRSDYNFFVDQSYIYDSGAIILNQNDGAVFKVGGGPIYVTNDSNNNLILNLKTTVLQGDYQAGGNGIETIQTQLDGSYHVSGFTDNVTITKNTTPELSYLWDSYFEELNSTICTTNANSTYDNMTLHIWSNTPNILLTVEQKEIEVS